MSSQADTAESAPQTETPPPPLTVVDPLSGKQVNLDYQLMSLHPCEIIAETTTNDDSIAKRVSKDFLDMREGKPTKPAVRATATRIETTDLFEPELLCTTVTLSSGRDDGGTAS